MTNDTDTDDTQTTVPDPDREETAGADATEGAEADGDKTGKDAIKGLDPEVQAKIDKRIGKEVAKRKAMEAELEELREERKRNKAERAQAEAEKYRGLPVPPRFFEEGELAEVEKADADATKNEELAQFWGNQEGDEVTVNGKTYTAKQCREFARVSAQNAGKAQGRKELLVSRAQSRMAKALEELEAGKASRGRVATVPPGKKPAKAADDDGDDGDSGGKVPSAGLPRVQDAKGTKVPELPKDQKSAKAWLNAID